MSRRRGFLKPLPLRARVILTFTLGTVLLAGFLVTTTYWLSRESMLHQRESASRSQFFANARLTKDQHGGVASSNPSCHTVNLLHG